MAKPRARLTDANDPLTSTDSVLAGFEQVSKLTSQQSNNTTSQEDKDQTEGTISQLEQKTTRQEVKKLASQEVDKSTLEQVVLPASRQVGKSAIRKCTFQLNEEILKQLDIFHLQLQLELGKSDAPYKEVIVEEAIAQLLEFAAQNRATVLAQLKERQAQR
jgi:hypothetical protein